MKHSISEVHMRGGLKSEYRLRMRVLVIERFILQKILMISQVEEEKELVVVG